LRPPGLAGRIDAGQEVQRAEILVLDLGADDMSGGDEQAVPDRDQRPLLPRRAARRRY
jgi:hypothetical protein